MANASNSLNNTVILGKGVGQRVDFKESRRYGYKPIKAEGCPSLANALRELGFTPLQEGVEPEESKFHELIRDNTDEILVAVVQIDEDSYLFSKVINEGIKFVLVSPEACECSGFLLKTETHSGLSGFFTCGDIENRYPCDSDKYKRCTLHERRFSGDSRLNDFIRSMRICLSTRFRAQLREIPVFPLSSALDIARWHKFCSINELALGIDKKSQEGQKARFLELLAEIVKPGG